MSFWQYGPYVSVAQKKAKALKQLKKLQTKGGNLDPISIEGHKIACKWWGISWNKNLERYADYSNRIGRGRAYVRHGMVLDLQIEAGKITALVAGTSSRPYKVDIAITKLTPAVWKQMIASAGDSIESIQALLEGRFPEDLKEVFFQSKAGLFPSPGEIKFDCSCPDWADMCKHVAAALFGVSARLDDRPELFFTLRGVKMEELAGKAAQAQSQKLLKTAKTASKRKLDLADDELSGLFGIDMTEVPIKTRIKSGMKKAATGVAKKKATKVATSKATKVAKKTAAKVIKTRLLS